MNERKAFQACRIPVIFPDQSLYAVIQGSQFGTQGFCQAGSDFLLRQLPFQYDLVQPLPNDRPAGG